MDRATEMKRALSPAAAGGDDVALKLRERIITATIADGVDPDLVADGVLDFLFMHMPHDTDCEIRKTAEVVIGELVAAGLNQAILYANDPANRSEDSNGEDEARS